MSSRSDDDIVMHDALEGVGPEDDRPHQSLFRYRALDARYASLNTRSHQRRCSRYQRTVSSSPGRNWWRGRQASSEEHTSELQSRLHLVCRLLLEKKKK